MALCAAAAPHTTHFIPAPVTDLPLHGALSAAVYTRLLLAELMPTVENVLYLDSDVVVLSDLSPLLSTDVSGVGVAAVQDHFWRHGPNDPDSTGYFNSGVMLLNLEFWRRNSLQVRFESYVRNQFCRFWDQDALNYVCREAWLELDPRWNVFHFDEVGDPSWGSLAPRQTRLWWSYLQRSAWIMHYVTGVKPWLESYPPGRNYARFRSASQ